MNIISIVGARPQFIKAAVLSKAIREYNERSACGSQHVKERIIHTGQHFDENMSRIFFLEMGIPEPDHYLGICGASHGAMTGRMLEKIESVLLEEKPEIVMVYGDTNSTLAGALSAAKLHIPVGHVEAGLRSFNRRMPEEINRVVADHVSTLLFCPTEQAVKNLRHEGIENFVHLVGDVMYDSCLYYGAIAEEKSTILESLSLKPKSYLLATIHRAENTDDPERLHSIIEGLAEVAEKHNVILPIHPRTRNILENNPSLKEAACAIRFIEPVGYLDMIMLEKNAFIIATDSGGVQKEAYFLNVPCITLRDETEWVELVELGCNYVAGADKDRFKKAFEKFLQLEIFPTPSKPLYGNGQSGREILGLTVEYLKSL